MSIIGFWHHFGPYGGETRNEIVERKQREIAANYKKHHHRWTFWSFQSRAKDMLSLWINTIDDKNPSKVLVFCSCSHGATDPCPKDELPHATKYLTHKSVWKDIPKCVEVPQLFLAKEEGDYATAFKVAKIERTLPSKLQKQEFQWLDKYGCWHTRNKAGKPRIPSRGEFLLKPVKAGGIILPPICAVLTLEKPYVVHILK